MRSVLPVRAMRPSTRATQAWTPSSFRPGDGRFSVRTADVTVWRSRVGLAGRGVELLEDAAPLVRVGRAALRAQRLQIFLQGAQFANAVVDVLNVLIEQFVDLAAALYGPIAKLQQHPDLVQRHVQAAALAGINPSRS